MTTERNPQGQWTYTRNPENTRWIIDSAPAHAIACTAGYACDDESIARLIASAPELLAALQLAVSYGWDHESARAAISKATAPVKAGA